MKQLISQFPRCQLLPESTLITKLHRLPKIIGGANIYIKRDDINYLGGGGNKLRKLEFYLGEAKAQGCDTIIAMGAWQSNHARLSAAAALHAGFSCELVLGKKVSRHDYDYGNNGNNVLERAMGVRIHALTADIDLMQFTQERKAELELAGKKPYIIPFGGSDALGSLGYVNCALEIAKQEAEKNIKFDYIITPNGSSGTHAGLLVGAKIANLSAKVVGYNVLSSTEQTLPTTLKLAHEIDTLLGCDLSITADDIILNDKYLGDGYGQPTNEMRKAVKLLAHEEGLFLDPVYSGKAFAGMLADIENETYQRDKNILYLMTGGTPALYAYQSEF